MLYAVSKKTTIPILEKEKLIIREMRTRRKKQNKFYDSKYKKRKKNQRKLCKNTIASDTRIHANKYNSPKKPKKKHDKQIQVHLEPEKKRKWNEKI